MRRFLLDLRQKYDQAEENMHLEPNPDAIKLHVDQLRQAGPDTRGPAASGSRDSDNEITAREKQGGDNQRSSITNKNRFYDCEAAGGLYPNVYCDAKETNEVTGNRVESSPDGDDDSCNRDNPGNRRRSSGNCNSALLRRGLNFREIGDRWHKEDRGLDISSGESNSSSSGDGSSSYDQEEARPTTIEDGLKEVTSWVNSFLPQTWLRETDSRNAVNKNLDTERACRSGRDDEGPIDFEKNVQRTNGTLAAVDEMEEWGSGDSVSSASNFNEDGNTVDGEVKLDEIGATSLALWLKDRDRRDLK